MKLYIFQPMCSFERHEEVYTSSTLAGSLIIATHFYRFLSDFFDL